MRGATPLALTLGGILVAVVLTAPPPASARTRTICSGSFTCNETVSPFGFDIPVSIPGSGYACGTDRQMVCDTGAQCDAGHAPVDNTLSTELPFTIVCPTVAGAYCNPAYNIPDDTVSSACYACGKDQGPGTSRLGCNSASPCEAGLEHITPASTSLNGPITACPSYLPPDPGNVDYAAQSIPITIGSPVNQTFNYSVAAVHQDMPSSATIVNTEGVCTDGLPQDFSGASRDSWPASDPGSALPGTVFVIHGRGANCSGGRNGLLNEGGLLRRNYLVYCVEYAQVSHSGPGDPPTIQTVRVLPVLEEASGEGTASCLAAGDCSFDRNNPIFQKEAASLSVVAIADVLAEAIRTVPTVGDITLVPHSQGGFIARSLIDRHYDDLRWSGKKLLRMISLAHPYFAKEEDPQKYVPWLCSGPSEGNLDCAVGRWLRGWDDSLAAGGGQIDDSEFPQMRWIAVAGDGFDEDGTGPGGITIESLDGSGCSIIFGGINGTTVTGDTSVPIQSSLGIDEFDFYPIAQLQLDGSSMERCGHNAPCLLRERLKRAPGDLPQVSPRATGFGALEFDGVDDRLVISDPVALSGLELSGSLTLEAWIQPQRSDSGYIVSKQGEYQLFLSAGKVFWAIRNTSPGWTSIDTGYAPPIYRWTHIAFVYDQALGKARTYANGVLVHERDASGPVTDFDPSNDEFRVGDRQISGARFDGLIDEVRIWSRALTQDELTDRLEGVPGGPEAGLRGWWKFDEPGLDVLEDASGNGLAMALDATSASPRRHNGSRKDGRLGGAYYFDGVNDHITVSNPASLPQLAVSTALTVEAWVYPRVSSDVPPGAGGAIVSKEGEYQLTRLADGRLGFTLAATSPGWSTRATTTILPAFQWSHVALVFDDTANVARIYLNGALVHEEFANGPIGDFAAHAAQDELWIGSRQATGNNQWFHGAIDEVRVWNVARSGGEIAAAMSAPLAGNEPGLIGYWRFDELTTGVAFD